MNYNSIVVLTGAGISAESGLDTFRGLGGLWENHRIEDVASPAGFVRDPDLVHKFYNLRRRRLVSGEVQPNAAHAALARLEREFPGDSLLVTQNIDDLHERAGSRNLVHMHGELLKARCAACESVIETTGDLSTGDACRHCGASGAMRPHVVWFGEMPLALDRVIDALEHCGLFVSIGTSGQVYPAAGFVEVARRAGARTMELNLEQSDMAGAFDESVVGRATEIVPRVVDHLLDGRQASIR